MDDAEVSASGSGVWEKSENSRWVVVRETKHKIPRRSRQRSVGSVDPSLGIHKFVTKFEVELPREGANTVVVNDGTSMVRLEAATSSGGGGAGGEGTLDPGPSTSAAASGALQREDNESESLGMTSRSRRRRRRGRGREQTDAGAGRRGRRRVACVSVESSPGRASPSPESLNRIVHKYSSDILNFS